MRADLYPLQVLLVALTGWISQRQQDVVAYVMRWMRHVDRKDACVESGSQISVNPFRLTSVVVLDQDSFSDESKGTQQEAPDGGVLSSPPPDALPSVLPPPSRPLLVGGCVGRSPGAGRLARERPYAPR